MAFMTELALHHVLQHAMHNAASGGFDHMIHFSEGMTEAAARSYAAGLVLALGVVLAMLVAGPAAARPRDTVLSNAFRCATIGDARTWLDCYYGAAQPVRESLGLQPAPASQLSLVAQPPAGTPSAADLTIRDAVMNGAVQCSGLGQARQWLDCYYAAARPMRAHLGLEGGTVKQPVQPASAVSDFGKQAVAMPPLGNTDHIFSMMRAYTFDKLGWFTVTLQNGQVWQQVHGDTTVAHWRKPAGTYRVRISEGFLGSYNLQVVDNPGLFKVRRVQ